jgi:hypothetical protein
VGGLDVADVEVVVREDGAADGVDEDHPIADAEIVDRLGNVLVDVAMAAPRTVVGDRRIVPLALEDLVEGSGPFTQ